MCKIKTNILKKNYTKYKICYLYGTKLLNLMVHKTFQSVQCVNDKHLWRYCSVKDDWLSCHFQSIPKYKLNRSINTNNASLHTIIHAVTFQIYSQYHMLTKYIPFSEPWRKSLQCIYMIVKFFTASVANLCMSLYIASHSQYHTNTTSCDGIGM